MYDPAEPPNIPAITDEDNVSISLLHKLRDLRDLQLEIPTVISSLLVSKASPMSIDIAATSKQEENETTNTMPGQ